ncbi:54S ribosomal protein L8, mitochondrial [Neurospora sp. IMI 360204]|nr:54S ribosomal protein L8, mitochondrial [Neurospora sp. IMI 360204]
MAGAHVKYRHLSRSSAHRQALLRNLVTSLIKNETIHTTYPKAKEAQRLAEKLITLSKRDTETARRSAQGILYTPDQILPKLFGEIRERYANRPGGYTRVLRTEPKDQYSQAPSAILELVDGPKDMRFAMTAATVARDREQKTESTDLTKKNMDKVTRFRKDGMRTFEDMVAKLRDMKFTAGAINPKEWKKLDR